MCRGFDQVNYTNELGVFNPFPPGVVLPAAPYPNVKNISNSNFPGKCEGCCLFVSCLCCSNLQHP